MEKLISKKFFTGIGFMLIFLLEAFTSFSLSPLQVKLLTIAVCLYMTLQTILDIIKAYLGRE